MELFVVCFSIAIFLIYRFIVAYFFGEISKEKGYKSTKYFVLCFFFGIAGWLLVAALPDRKYDYRRNEIGNSNVHNNEEYQIKQEHGENKNSVSVYVILAIIVAFIILVLVFCSLFQFAK